MDIPGRLQRWTAGESPRRSSRLSDAGRSGEQALACCLPVRHSRWAAHRPPGPERCCRPAAESSPDLILLGGDYVSLDHRDVSAFAQRLAPLRSRCEIFAVLGNHDLWQDEAAIRRVLEDAGVIVLVNESRRLAAPFQRVVVYGMDEPGTGDPKPPPPPTDDSLRIVIMHSPLGVRLLAPGTFHVAFCGHTHGGQIALPSGRPLLLPIGAGDRKQAGGGVFPVKGGHLLISRGVGMSDLPVRLFAHSEIHACVFEPAST
jgi:uncharacterized protein